MTEPRVLLVDDSELDRELAREMLPWPVSGVAIDLTTAQQMMRASQFAEYDIILLDQHFPDGLGTEALQAWRAAGMAKPVIGMLGSGSPIDREAFFEAGANATVPKEAFVEGDVGHLISQLTAPVDVAV